MLGNDCKTVLTKEYEVIAPERKELDITSWDAVIEKLHKISPDIILNCAAFTDVDACEKEHFVVRKTNVEGPRNLAQGSARFNCKLIHISSDYVFNGQKIVPQPYFEDDSLEPISQYGKSKMESEISVRENAPNYIIVRSGWLYGFSGKNFITSILAVALNRKRRPLRVVSDQFGSPTWTYRVALQIKELIRTNAMGTYHATSEGFCSRFEYAQCILDRLEIKTPIEPCPMEEFDLSARRPVNCILENRLLKKQGINIMREWKTDLETFLDRFGSELVKQSKAGKS
jgi:dTDP-4-dehydrorhamnose reductase